LSYFKALNTQWHYLSFFVPLSVASSHGKANMMCFNYMEDHGAFIRNAEGKQPAQQHKKSLSISFDRLFYYIRD
jgi:hypothetical protein